MGREILEGLPEFLASIAECGGVPSKDPSSASFGLEHDSLSIITTFYSIGNGISCGEGMRGSYIVVPSSSKPIATFVSFSVYMDCELRSQYSKHIWITLWQQ